MESLLNYVMVLKSYSLLPHSDEFSPYPGGSTEIYPLLGIIFKIDGTIKGASENWKECGAYRSCQGGLDDCRNVGEHKLTSRTSVGKKGTRRIFLSCLCDGNPDLPLKVIAKTKKRQSLVMQPEDGIINHDFVITMEWFFVKNLIQIRHKHFT